MALFFFVSWLSARQRIRCMCFGLVVMNRVRSAFECCWRRPTFVAADLLTELRRTQANVMVGHRPSNSFAYTSLHLVKHSVA